MKESGCFGVKIGFESGNQTVVDTIVNKRLNLEYARQAVRRDQARRHDRARHLHLRPARRDRTSRCWTPSAISNRSGSTRFQESGCAEIEGTPLHTLAQSGSLQRYSGARTDGAEYLRESDGRVKYEKLAASLH